MCHSEEKVYDPFFFEEDTITVTSCLSVLLDYLMDQLQENSQNITFQQDGASPHWQHNLHVFLNANLPNQWTGRAGKNDSHLLQWPPRSHDLTPRDFFLVGGKLKIVFMYSYFHRTSTFWSCESWMLLHLLLQIWYIKLRMNSIIAWTCDVSPGGSHWVKYGLKFREYLYEITHTFSMLLHLSFYCGLWKAQRNLHWFSCSVSRLR